MNKINNAIDALMLRKKIPSNPSLSYTLNNNEIALAESILCHTNQSIILMKTTYKSCNKIYYYKHVNGNFIVGLNSDGDVVTIC
jgi:hypothetical protein